MILSPITVPFLSSAAAKELLKKGVFWGVNDAKNLLRFYAPMITMK